MRRIIHTAHVDIRSYVHLLFWRRLGKHYRTVRIQQRALARWGKCFTNESWIFNCGRQRCNTIFAPCWLWIKLIMVENQIGDAIPRVHLSFHFCCILFWIYSKAVWQRNCCIEGSRLIDVGAFRQQQFYNIFLPPHGGTFQWCLPLWLIDVCLPLNEQFNNFNMACCWACNDIKRMYVSIKAGTN